MDKNALYWAGAWGCASGYAVGLGLAAAGCGWLPSKNNVHNQNLNPSLAIPHTNPQPGVYAAILNVNVQPEVLPARQ